MNNVNNSDTQQQHQQQQQHVNGISNGSHVHSIIQSDISTTATATKSSNTPYKNGITNHTNGSSDHCNGVDSNTNTSSNTNIRHYCDVSLLQPSLPSPVLQEPNVENTNQSTATAAATAAFMDTISPITINSDQIQYTDDAIIAKYT
jgi:hypothetical protein